MATLLSAPACPGCRTAKATLSAKGVQFEVVDVTAGDCSPRLAALATAVPAVLTCGGRVCIVGADSIRAWAEAGAPAEVVEALQFGERVAPAGGDVARLSPPRGSPVADAGGPSPRGAAGGRGPAGVAPETGDVALEAAWELYQRLQKAGLDGDHWGITMGTHRSCVSGRDLVSWWLRMNQPSPEDAEAFEEEAAATGAAVGPVTEQDAIRALRPLLLHGLIVPIDMRSGLLASGKLYRLQAHLARATGAFTIAAPLDNLPDPSADDGEHSLFATGSSPRPKAPLPGSLRGVLAPGCWAFEPPCGLLNCTFAFTGKPRPPEAVARSLQRRALAMVEAFTDPAGTHVNYREMRRSPQLRAYCKVAAELQCTDVSAVAGGGPCAKAFFLNLYNAMVCHGLCAFGRSPTLAMTCFFDRVQYRVGPWRLSLNDIEHGVLRCNRPRPSSLSAPFGACDARKCLSFRSVDPRVHFALNCGARSCPAIRIYCPFSVDKALDTAVAAFLAVPQNFSVDACTGEVRLSKLFAWYRQDFAGESPVELLRWMLPFMPPSRQQAAKALLGEAGGDAVADAGVELLPVAADGRAPGRSGSAAGGGDGGGPDVAAATGTAPPAQHLAADFASHTSDATSWASAPRSCKPAAPLPRVTIQWEPYDWRVNGDI
ncbi:hypothetical protein FNF29_02094 [Cafeteria roenbergensis]|uniref:Uncharacterized protein n=1 Tax=Cafeteria roenbergensis TaxID=33653 RepID=A0A5A8CS18_CAFRO|nr:hypothetical protein FNF29_02094 [Cafeteria roenbergensis]|eukprot:KAA0154950.1 hypothetical protein FNF29_02094 [Cafeteria roenbergensis]